jgi:hypothetical protein
VCLKRCSIEPPFVHIFSLFFCHLESSHGWPGTITGVSHIWASFVAMDWHDMHDPLANLYRA